MNDQKVAITTSEYEVERSNSSVLSYLLEYNFSCMSLIGIRVCPRSRVRIPEGFYTFLEYIESGLERSNPGSALLFGWTIFFMYFFYRLNVSVYFRNRVQAVSR